MDFCEPNPCENNGTCFSSENEIVCLCRDGIQGEFCQIGKAYWARVAWKLDTSIVFSHIVHGCILGGFADFGNSCNISLASRLNLVISTMFPYLVCWQIQ